jgi:hypothetical protein
LWVLDREFRRAAAIVGARAYHGLPAPLSTRYGGLSIREANVGSLELILDPYGVLRDLLLSDPLQMAVTAYALLGGARKILARLTPPPPGKPPEQPVSVIIPGKVRVTAPADAEVHVLLPGGGEVHIGPDD